MFVYSSLPLFISGKILPILFALGFVFFTPARSTPSIFYNSDFDADEDARDIHHAVKGPGTDEGLLLEIITDRTCPQRLEIKQAFQKIYNYDLPKRLGEDTSGTYEQLLRDSFICGDEIFVQHLWRALHGENKNGDQKHADKSVIEILTIYSENNERRKALLDGYQKLYNTPLVDDLKKTYGSGNFLDACIEVATPRERKARELIDDKAADETGSALNHESGNWNDSHDLLTITLLETSFEQLTSVFNAFRKKNGKDIAAVVKKKMKEPLRNLYQDLITFVRWYANAHREYYAIRLYESVDGPGTHESCLIRTILAHSETDMKELEDQFRINYTRELRSKIAHDTSGDFEALLKAFLPRTPAEEAEKKKKREELRRKQKERKKVRAALGLPDHVDLMSPGAPTNHDQRMMVDPSGMTYPNTMRNPNMMANPTMINQRNMMVNSNVANTPPLIPDAVTIPYSEMIRYQQDVPDRFQPHPLQL